MACSFTSFMSGTRLHVKDDIQENNIEEFLSTLPKLTSAHGKIRLTFDRDYGKIPFVGSNSKRNVDVSTIGTTDGSRNPFIPLSELTVFITKCRILIDTEDKTK